MRKLIQIFCYYLLPLLGAYFLFLSPDREIYEITGQLAVLSLLVLLFLKPLAVLTQSKLLLHSLPWRRELGVFCFWTALIHSIGLFRPLHSYDLSLLTNGLFWGYLAFAAIFLLGLTSNDLSTKLLKHNWKRLQYLAYPALLLTLLHVELLKAHTFYLSLIVFGVFAALKLFEWHRSK